MIDWIQLPHLPEWYQFDVTDLVADISISRHCGLMYQMSLNFRNLTIRDKLIRCVIKPTDKIVLNGWKAYHLRRLMKKPYYIIVAVLNDEKKREESILVKPLEPVIEGNTKGHWNAAYVTNEGQKAAVEPKCSLYPVLPEITDIQSA